MDRGTLVEGKPTPVYQPDPMRYVLDHAEIWERARLNRGRGMSIESRSSPRTAQHKLEEKVTDLFDF